MYFKNYYSKRKFFEIVCLLFDRKEQLTKEQETFREAHEKWVHLDERLSYLLGCIDTIVYLQTGKLPSDGNHDGMKAHQPREQ